MTGTAARSRELPSRLSPHPASAGNARYNRGVKRSEINALVRDASACFASHGWTLPPEPRWDVTDFGRGDCRSCGLVLVNLAEEPEYCEKLMYARRGMVTPAHAHKAKKEDIVVRWGALRVRLWPGEFLLGELVVGEAGEPVRVKVNGAARRVGAGATVELQAGERITLFPGVVHEFSPLTDECILGEVSTANDDVNDNVFTDPEVGRFAAVEEDEPPRVRLVGEG